MHGYGSCLLSTPGLMILVWLNPAVPSLTVQLPAAWPCVHHGRMHETPLAGCCSKTQQQLQESGARPCLPEARWLAVRYLFVAMAVWFARSPLQNGDSSRIVKTLVLDLLRIQGSETIRWESGLRRRV